MTLFAAMLWANSGVGAQLAVFNIRDSIPSGYVPQNSALSRPTGTANSAAPFNVVTGDAFAALSFNDSEIVVRVSGQDIWAVSLASQRACGNLLE